MSRYVAPSYKAIHTKELTARKADLVRQVNDLMGSSIEKYSDTIYSNQYDIAQSQPLLNVIHRRIKGGVLQGTINTTGHYKDHDYLASQIRPFVEWLGPQHVVQICTDNVANMLSATQVLKQEYPHVYVQGCDVDCLDLLIED